MSDETVAKLRARKQAAREALEIAHDRYVAACIELATAKRARKSEEANAS